MIYVAASSKELDRAMKWMRRLREEGISVTSSWPDAILKGGDANPRAAPLNDRQRWALQDLEAIKNAQVLWMLIPKETSFGACVEFGYALGLGRRVIVSGDSARSIFTSLAAEHLEDIEAFTKIVEFFRAKEALLVENFDPYV